MISRRLLPPTLAGLVVLTTIIIPLRFGVASDRVSDIMSLGLLVVTNIFLVGLFLWMRNRMGDPRTMTLFGMALYGGFGSLSLLFAVKAVLWGFFLWSVWTLQPWSRSTTIALRAMVDGTVILVLISGFGIAWEMRRARVGSRMVVRIPTDGTEDWSPSPTAYEGPERRSGLERRSGPERRSWSDRPREEDEVLKSEDPEA